MARTLTCLHGNTVSPGVKDPCGTGGTCCIGRSYPDAAYQHSVPLWHAQIVWFAPGERTRTLNCLHSNVIFLGVEEPCGCGGANCMGGKVTRWSQSALCATVACSDSV